MTITQYDTMNAVHAVDGYFIPAPHEITPAEHEVAFKRAKETQKAELLGRLMPPTAIKTYGSRRFIGLSLRNCIEREVNASMYEVVLRLAGEGSLVKDENGVRVLDLVILDGTYDVLGDWIVRYSIDSDSGASVERVWIAAEIKDEREFTQWNGDSDGTVGVD